jgi:hypothetical protein
MYCPCSLFILVEIKLLLLYNNAVKEEHGMKILVTEMPESPRDCLFSKQVAFNNYEPVYACNLREYIEEADDKDNGYKPKCLCKNCSHCKKLEAMK